MPELPEVETVCSGLRPVMEGGHIARLSFSDKRLRFPYPDDLRQMMQGAAMSKLYRRGKYMVGLLSNDHAVIMHLGMSGSFRIVPVGQDYKSVKHDHVHITMKDGVQIIYNDPRRFGFFDLVQGDPERHYKPFTLMGPEPLSDDFSAGYLHERLKVTKAPIKQALLDQSVVAGLGNIYVCEALYKTGIHPKRAADKISLKRLSVLIVNIRSVLNAALASGGSSLKDHKGVDGTMGYFQHHFDVYGREGEVCRHDACIKAGQPCIRRITQSGRSTFYCVNSQR